MDGKKKKSYPASFKLKVVDVAEQKGKHFASKVFNVDRKRVREWVQNKEKIQTFAKLRKRATGAGKRVGYPDIEENLLAWFNERRSAGIRVTGKALKYEALRLHKAGGNQSFKASCGWFRRFKTRNNISFRRTTHVAQHSRELTDDRVDNFLRFTIKMRKLRDYSDSEIANMDETPVWMEMPGKVTLNEKGANSVTVSSTGHEKEKLTVTLGAYADGTKMAPLVHLPGVRPLPKEDIPSGVVVYMCGSGKKSWANEQSIIFWLNKLFGGKHKRRRRLLVWDAFRGHLTAKVKDHVRNACNADLCVIPGGCTCRLQPADVSWNKPFKARMAELYDQWMFEGPVELTAAGNRRGPPKRLVLRWIKDAWGTITPEMIRKSFKKCGITSALDGTEDHMFQQSDDEEVDEFEGFSRDDVAIEEQFLENVTMNDEVELSDSDSADTDTDTQDDNLTDYESPGH
ncbi:MAG: hypothetical protein ABW185_04590 [Sedimenticola sp.]